jgi:hypothetical protein
MALRKRRKIMRGEDRHRDYVRGCPDTLLIGAVREG